MGKTASAAIALALLTSGCGGSMVAGTDAGCFIYAIERANMPRPLPDNDLGAWVADTDAALTGACR